MGEHFNENLKEARLKSGLSQKDLSENIGVAKSTYSLYESGKREPNVDTIKKIASALNVSADMLLGLEAEPLLPPTLTVMNTQKMKWKKSKTSLHL